MDYSKTEVFLQEWARMCRLCKRDAFDCAQCPMYDIQSVWNDIDGAIKMVQKWSDEHPRGTRQSKFFELFPNAKTEKGVITIEPCLLEGDCIDLSERICSECKIKYWLSEVE